MIRLQLDSTGCSTSRGENRGSFPLGGESERLAAVDRHRRRLWWMVSSRFEETMVLTKSELIASLQNEVRILRHLAGKVDRARLDYRPTPKQRSTIELLKYLSMM